MGCEQSQQDNKELMAVNKPELPADNNKDNLVENEDQYNTAELEKIKKIQAHARGNKTRKTMNIEKEKKEKEKWISQIQCNKVPILSDFIQKKQEELKKLEIPEDFNNDLQNNFEKKENYVLNNQAKYSGQWKDGKMCGYGKTYYPDGSFYEGYFLLKKLF